MSECRTLLYARADRMPECRTLLYSQADRMPEGMALLYAQADKMPDGRVLLYARADRYPEPSVTACRGVGKGCSWGLNVGVKYCGRPKTHHRSRRQGFRLRCGTGDGGRPGDREDISRLRTTRCPRAPPGCHRPPWGRTPGSRGRIPCGRSRAPSWPSGSKSCRDPCTG